MKKLTTLLWIPFVLQGLSGCSSSPYADRSRLCADSNGEFYQCSDLSIASSRVQTDPTLFKTDLNFQLLSEYTEQMAADLQQDLAGVTIEEPIFVTSFVYFDSTLQQTSLLGNQLAEFFINDLQQIGLPVSDHKVTGRLVVNADGDFALSRDKTESRSTMKNGYGLIGTLVENERGTIVNARIVHFRTKKVIASASKFLPNILAAR